MLKKRALPAVALLAAFLFFVPAWAEEPPNVTYSPAPPGTVVTNEVVYLGGEAMHSQWRAVVSKKSLGSGNGNTFYQWYLSIYAIDGSVYHLKYQSPSNGGPLSKVTQVAGGDKMWFPVQTVSIVGTPTLVQPDVQQLVVQSHEMAADCGGSMVTVFTATPEWKVVPALTIRNGCDLTASIDHTNAADSLVLHGPYYAPNAAMCCPTKPKASATVVYRNGTWTQTPKYYEMFIGKFPPE